MYRGNDLVYAIANREEEEVYELIADGFVINLATDAGVTPLMAAANSNNYKIYKLLKSKGASHLGIVNLKSDQIHDGMDLLWLAVNGKNLSILESVLDIGFNPNKELNGITPLIHDARRCSSAGPLLIQYGGNVNFKGMDGKTPLHEAVASNCYYSVAILLQNGANPWIKDSFGKMPLDYIDPLKNTKMIKGLFQNMALK